MSDKPNMWERLESMIDSLTEAVAEVNDTWPASVLAINIENAYGIATEMRTMLGKEMRAYEGPFDPPPAESMEGALAWRFVSRQIGGNRWEPVAWEIVKGDGILTVDYHTHMGVRDSILYAP